MAKYYLPYLDINTIGLAVIPPFNKQTITSGVLAML
jgi:hypothetical protein